MWSGSWRSSLSTIPCTSLPSEFYGSGRVGEEGERRRVERRRMGGGRGRKVERRKGEEGRERRMGGERERGMSMNQYNDETHYFTSEAM